MSWYLVVCVSYFSVSDDASECLRGISVKFYSVFELFIFQYNCWIVKKIVGNKVADNYSVLRAWIAGTLSISFKRNKV